ncbi:MAG: hypothetical protein IJ679_11795 [Lachnospiraceae bacterium]|nr:hypothetical protein [Lachnospiraceae bacterium]
MSQAKIDYRKELKKNRKKILKKEKRERVLGYCVGILIAAAIAGWVGYSAYGLYEEAHANDPLPEISADISSVEDYLTDLNTAE